MDEPTCPACGGDVPPKMRPQGPRATYCSRRCRDAACYQRSKGRGARQQRDLTPKACPQCLAMFVPNRDRQASLLLGILHQARQQRRMEGVEAVMLCG